MIAIIVIVIIIVVVHVVIVVVVVVVVIGTNFPPFSHRSSLTVLLSPFSLKSHAFAYRRAPSHTVARRRAPSHAFSHILLSPSHLAERRLALAEQ